MCNAKWCYSRCQKTVDPFKTFRDIKIKSRWKHTHTSQPYIHEIWHILTHKHTYTGLENSHVDACNSVGMSVQPQDHLRPPSRVTEVSFCVHPQAESEKMPSKNSMKNWWIHDSMLETIPDPVCQRVHIPEACLLMLTLTGDDALKSRAGKRIHHSLWSCKYWRKATLHS